MTQLVARLFLPASAMIAAATLVKGYTDTGDGFSAGVILSLGVLLQCVSFGYGATMERYPFLTYAVPMAYGGLLLAALVAFVPVLRGDPIMTHYPRPGSHVIHIGSIEALTAVLFDISVFQIVFGFCVGALGFIARASSSSPFGRAFAAHRGDQDQTGRENRRLMLNEATSPVMTEPIRSEANGPNGEPE
jgi:multisubunit Na+/H+ antiporter MnhB subunit